MRIKGNEYYLNAEGGSCWVVVNGLQYCVSTASPFETGGAWGVKVRLYRTRRAGLTQTRKFAVPVKPDGKVGRAAIARALFPQAAV